MAEQSTTSVAHYDVIVVGAGPAGLSCALNLVRSHVRVLVLDANRPRHAATLKSHGFLTRDGVAPSELRRSGREELLRYSNASYVMGKVTTASYIAMPPVFATTDKRQAIAVEYQEVRGVARHTVTAAVVVVATGLTEILPDIAELRAYYGTALHSCVICDGFEKTGQELVLLPHPDHAATTIASAASQMQRFSSAVTVVPDAAAIVGEYGEMTGVLTRDGTTISATAGFVLPKYSVQSDFLTDLGVPQSLPGQGLVDILTTDTDPQPASNIGVAGVFAVGEAYTGKPQQLVVAAGHGASVVPDIIGSLIA